MNKFYGKVFATLAVASMCGCMIGPDFEQPKLESMPEKYSSSQIESKATAKTERRELSDAELASWWKVFNDPVLTSLVERAFESNLDLAAAVAKIKQSRASLGVSQSGFFPTLDVDAGFRDGGRTWQSHSSYSAGTSAAWEVDIFGGTRRGIEAAVADYKASMADKCATKVAVAAEVAQEYFRYRAYERELFITKSNLETQRKTYDVTLRRRANGFESDIDVVRARSQVESTSAQIPQLERDMTLSRHALELLLALPTGSLKDELAKNYDLPELENFIPIGVPAKLIQRRPDVVLAEHKLHSAVAKIGEAKADWYPKFSITGRIGYEAPNASDLFKNQYGTWSVGPSVSWNVFQAGRTYYNVEMRKAAAEAAGVSWDKTVLTAIKEVEDALVSAAKERERIAYINKVVSSNRRAFELSSRLYSEGEIEFLDLLEAQRSMLVSEQNQVSCRRLFISHIISLYKSLGGGWSVEDVKDDPEETKWLFFLDGDEQIKEE